MKKIFCIALAATAVIACTKTEANFTQSEEISFMPVSKFDTKAAVEGDKFTADQNFYVYANAKNDGVNTFTSKYFVKELFVPKDGEKNGNLQVYGGYTPQYWPNVNPLIFAGYTASGNVEDLTATVADNLSTITLDGYNQPAPTAAAQNDFMYFFDNNSGSGYVKADYVSPVMKHACSWITINISADSELVSYWENLKVTNVKFDAIHSTGKVTFKSTPAVEWDYTGKTAAAVNVLTTAKTLSATASEFADVADNTIVLPQTPSKLSVTYTYTTPAGVENFTETKVVPLNFNGEAATVAQADWAKWQPGVHYTYNLTITAKEIKISPSSTGWTSQGTVTL